jgi:CD2 antigen cytoplasmic tail-binding protein 2
MKEELEEGDFDTDGYYHWKSKKGEVHDAWLDNIDWANINEIKKFKGQDSLLSAAAKSGLIKEKYDLAASNEKEVDDESSGTDESLSGANLNENEQTELFRKILEFLKPGESILKSIKRLGNTGGANKANLSASQRWIKKKQVDVSLKSEDSKANAEALEKLTSLANKFIEMGYYDVYEETYEKIMFKLNGSKSKIDNDFDIFADNVDANKLEKETVSSGKIQIEGRYILV